MASSEVMAAVKVDKQQFEKLATNILQLHACAYDLKRASITKVNQASTAQYVAETITRIAQSLSLLELARL